MKEEVIQYVNNQLKVSEDRLKPYVQTGSWKYPYRPAFYRIKKYVGDFINGNKEVRWIIIPGLRGVGKTTVAAQTFFYFSTCS